MSGTRLPVTGTGVGLTVAGATVYLGVWQIAVIGIALVAIGALAVRFGFRRGKPVGSP